MERVVITLRLKDGAHRQAAELIARGAPFDLQESGFLRHGVYLSSYEAIFFFEGHDVEWLVDALVFDPYQWMVVEAIEQWRPLVEEHPRVARERFFWQAKQPPPT